MEMGLSSSRTVRYYEEKGSTWPSTKNIQTFGSTSNFHIKLQLIGLHHQKIKNEKRWRKTSYDSMKLIEDDQYLE